MAIEKKQNILHCFLSSKLFSQDSVVADPIEYNTRFHAILWNRALFWRACSRSQGASNRYYGTAFIYCEIRPSSNYSPTIRHFWTILPCLNMMFVMKMRCVHIGFSQKKGSPHCIISAFARAISQIEGFEYPESYLCMWGNQNDENHNIKTWQALRVQTRGNPICTRWIIHVFAR